MMTFDELMKPSPEPDVIQKVSDSVHEYALGLIESGETDLTTLALLGAASGLLDAYALHLRGEQTATPNTPDPLTLSDM